MWSLSSDINLTKARRWYDKKKDGEKVNSCNWNFGDQINTTFGWFLFSFCAVFSYCQSLYVGIKLWWNSIVMRSASCLPTMWIYVVYLSIELGKVSSCSVGFMDTNNFLHRKRFKASEGWFYFLVVDLSNIVLKTAFLFFFHLLFVYYFFINHNLFSKFKQIISLLILFVWIVSAVSNKLYYYISEIWITLV